MGANQDVTDVIDQHRQALRDGGIIQAPAPTEKAVTIEFPVNLKRDSVRLTKRVEPAEGVYKVTCSLDMQTPIYLQVKLFRKFKSSSAFFTEIEKINTKVLAVKSERIDRTGINI